MDATRNVVRLCFLVSAFNLSCTVKNDADVSCLSPDTIIRFNISDLASEGCKATAHYTCGQIKKIESIVFYETGQAHITYDFKDTVIMVEEKIFSYDQPVNIELDSSDLKQEYRNNYSIKSNGDLITQGDSIHNIFPVLKNNIPFSLNQR